jgi:precorrin-3B synthase
MNGLLGVLRQMSRSINIAEYRLGQRLSPCPGLFRVVQSKDGGICRIKLPLGHFSAVQARAIAEAGGLFGNGQIEITNRANFQIRGIKKADEEALIAHLLDVSLGPDHASADDVRNLMVSANLGNDLKAHVDASELALQILNLLENTPRYHSLSPKFSILLDGGEADCAVDHPHDIWISATGSGFAFGIAGHPPLQPSDCRPVGQVGQEAVLALVAALLDLFLTLAEKFSSIRRFRDVAGEITETELQQYLLALPGWGEAPVSWLRAMPNRLSLVGKSEQSQAGLVRVGGVPPLGRLSPLTLTRLADLSVRANGGSLRLSPWQSVVLPHIPKSRGQEIVKGFDELGFAISGEDPFAQMVACAGSAGCKQALADVKADARFLASRLKTSRDIHLTACPKSCVSARTADDTLLAVGPDSYDLYRRDPAVKGAFGSLIGRAMTITQVADLLS